MTHFHIESPIQVRLDEKHTSLVAIFMQTYLCCYGNVKVKVMAM